MQVPGGTQALDRTELLPVRVASLAGLVPRPLPLDAIVSKAVAAELDDVPKAQRQDIYELI